MKHSRREFIWMSALAGCQIAHLPRVWAGGTDADVADAGSLETVDVPWLEEVQTAPASFPDLQLQPLLVDRQGRKIGDQLGWQERRKELREGWQSFLGTIAPNPQVPRPEILHEEHVESRGAPAVLRQRIRYEVEPGELVEAYLLRPAPDAARGKAKLPAIVALHSTTNATIRQPAGLEEDQRQAWGLQLARAGYVVICPPCFLWQRAPDVSLERQTADVLARHAGTKGMAKMLFDARRAVDVLEQLPDVDKQRIGTVGHSLGGKEAVYLAAFDDRIKVAVSSEGGIGLKFSNWEAPWYLGADIQQAGFDREHHELLALIAPKPFLLVGGDSADGDASWPYVAAALPVYDVLGEPRRLGLLNHRQGHSVPAIVQTRAREWFDAYL